MNDQDEEYAVLTFYGTRDDIEGIQRKVDTSGTKGRIVFSLYYLNPGDKGFDQESFQYIGKTVGFNLYRAWKEPE